MAQRNTEKQDDRQQDIPAAGIGAGDGNSGGGSGSGMPDAETGCVSAVRDDVETDRQKIFQNVGRETPEEANDEKVKSEDKKGEPNDRTGQTSDVPADKQPAPTAS